MTANDTGFRLGAGCRGISMKRVDSDFSAADFAYCWMLASGFDQIMAQRFAFCFAAINAGLRFCTGGIFPVMHGVRNKGACLREQNQSQNESQAATGSFIAHKQIPTLWYNKKRRPHVYVRAPHEHTARWVRPAGFLFLQRNAAGQPVLSAPASPSETDDSPAALFCRR